MKQERIFITGATGVLGHHIVKELIDNGYTNIVLLTRSGELNEQLLPYKDTVRVVKGNVRELYPISEEIVQADYVIHAAAVVSFDPRKRSELYHTNVEGTANVANLCLDAGIKKLVQISSIAAIGRPDKEGEVVSEATKWVESKYNAYYGVTKYKSEQEVWRAHTEGLPVVILNPTIVMGQGNYERSSLKIIKTIHKGLGYYPTGKVGVVDARDVAKMARILMESDISGERYIATRPSISYKTFFSSIANNLGVKAPAKPMTPFMAGLAWRVEKVKSFLTGSVPIITKETMMTSSYEAAYDTSKSENIPGFEYRPLEETIKWACGGYLNSIKKGS